MHYVKRNTCRIDNSPLKTILNLGEIYPSTFVKRGDGCDFVKVPLELCVGEKSKLVQLRHTVDRDALYRQYWYKSQLNSTMVQHLNDVVNNIYERVSLTPGDIIVDIGCNDGIMLSMFCDFTTVGFDPANNLKETAEQNCTKFINDYFSAKTYPFADKAKVITSVAMFYDLENPKEFISDVCEILRPDGVWVIQMTDLLCMLKANAFDNIVHEHLEYYSLDVLTKLFKEFGLQIWDIQYNKVNGGSVRLYVSFKDSPYQPTIDVLRANYVETDYMNLFQNPFESFRHRIEGIKENVVDFIRHERLQGKWIYGLGASTKGNTLLQYFDLTKEDISYIAEVNIDKVGLETIGTRIPIIPERLAFEDFPDYFLILPWHFIDSFVSNNKWYLDHNGKFIVPCPDPVIIGKDGIEERLWK
jgi:2-polyprenyl-3-methyl-5-hydroxy-6-metoxy-1,4-benzoquinol methylase